MWSAPQEPNGVIISYEVTYRDSEGNNFAANTTDLSTMFTILSLTAGTNVTNTSVSAYTSVGRGPAVMIPHLMLVEPPCELTLYSALSCYNYHHLMWILPFPNSYLLLLL